MPGYALAALLLLGAAAAWAAQPPAYSVIVGTVWDAGDRPAPDLVVKIRRAERTKPQWELRTNSHGEFAQRLPAGAADYVVWAEVNGRRRPETEVKVHIDYDERQDIGLHLKQ